MSRDYVLEAAQNNPWYLEAMKNLLRANLFQPLRLPSIKWRESRPGWIAKEALDKIEMDLLSSAATAWKKGLSIEFNEFDKFDSVEINNVWSVVDTAVDMTEINSSIFNHLALPAFTMNIDDSVLFFTTNIANLHDLQTTVNGQNFCIEPVLLIYLKDKKSRKPKTSHIIVQARIFLPQNSPFSSMRAWYPAPILVASTDAKLDFLTSRVTGCIYTELFLYAQHALLNRPEIIVEHPQSVQPNINEKTNKKQPVKAHRNIKAVRRVYLIQEPNTKPTRKYERHTMAWLQTGYIDKNGRKVPDCIKGPHRNKPGVEVSPKNYVIPDEAKPR